jgi:hypothetical protein
VRSAKRRGPDKDRPSCAQWPHNVRPLDYYLGAVVEPTPEPPTPPKPPKACDTCEAVSPLIDEALAQLRRLAVVQKTAPYAACEQALLTIRQLVPNDRDASSEALAGAIASAPALSDCLAAISRSALH